MIKIGDYVKIEGTGTIWDGKEGTVTEISDDEIVTTDGRDLTTVLVAVKLPTEKGNRIVKQDFNREDLIPTEPSEESKANEEKELVPEELTDELEKETTDEIEQEVDEIIDDTLPRLESLDESLNEALPKDLAAAYRRRKGVKVAGYKSENRPIIDHRNPVPYDFSKAEYKKMTPDEALKFTNNGRDKQKLSELRFIIGGRLIKFDERGVQTWFEGDLGWSGKIKKDNGVEVDDTRKLNAKEVINNATSIYWTDEDKHKLTSIDATMPSESGRDLDIYNRRLAAKGAIYKDGKTVYADLPRTKDTGDHYRNYDQEPNYIKERRERLRNYIARVLAKKPEEKSRWDDEELERYRRELNNMKEVEQRYAWSMFNLKALERKYKQVKEKVTSAKRRLDRFKDDKFDYYNSDTDEQKEARQTQERLRELDELNRKLQDVQDRIQKLQNTITPDKLEQYDREYNKEVNRLQNELDAANLEYDGLKNRFAGSDEVDL